jgi:glyoxylase-like metal-dependent hydrolase (beta-lactamase superfamily II)
LRYGADPDEIASALAALRPPEYLTRDALIDVGDCVVAVSHPGGGHTDHDLIAVVPSGERVVVFCGDLVEESGDPAVGDDSNVSAWPSTLARVLDLGGPDAIYVPGHGATVDARFVRAQRDQLIGMGRSMR